MNILIDLVNEFQIMGGRLEITTQGEIRLLLPKGKPDLIINELSLHKAELLDFLRQEKARKLYPYLGMMVRSPLGPGSLWQVFSKRVGIALEKTQKVLFFKPEHIKPS